MPRDEASNLRRMRQIDEVSSISDDPISLNTGKGDHVVAPAVDLMHRAVEPGRVLPSQDHCRLSSEPGSRRVLTHLKNKSMVLITDSFHPRNQPACRPSETTDDHIGQQPGGVKNQPVPLWNSGRTAAAGDEDHTLAVAPGSHFARQHAPEGHPTQDAGRPAQPQCGHHPGRVGRQRLVLLRQRQPGGLERDAKDFLSGEQAFVAGHAGEQNEPLRRHGGH